MPEPTEHYEQEFEKQCLSFQLPQLNRHCLAWWIICFQQGWTILIEKDKHRYLYQTKRTSRQTQIHITVLSYRIWPTYLTSNQALSSLNSRWWGMGHFLTNTWATFNFIYILDYYCLFFLNSVPSVTLSCHKK